MTQTIKCVEYFFQRNYKKKIKVSTCQHIMPTDNIFDRTTCERVKNQIRFRLKKKIFWNKLKQFLLRRIKSSAINFKYLQQVSFLPQAIVNKKQRRIFFFWCLLFFGCYRNNANLLSNSCRVNTTIHSI